jgi:ketosteroid isomerase-like protein
MARERVAALREGFELWNVAISHPDEATRREAMAKMSDVYRPEATVDFSRTTPDFPTTNAREAMRDWVEDARGTFSDVKVSPLEFIEGGDLVLTVIRITGTGALSGISMEADFTYVFVFEENDQITSATTYVTRADALEATGLAG